MADQEAVLKLIDQIYEAALEPARWSTVLTEWAELLSCQGGIIFAHDKKARVEDLLGLARIDETMWREYQDYYATVDIGVEELARRPHGSTVLDVGVSTEKLVKSEFFNDFWRPWGLRHNIGVTPLTDENRLVVTSFYRSPRMGPFNDEERRLFEALTPHLKRSMQIHRQVSHLDVAAATVGDALDRLPTGVLLLDAQGRLLTINRAAEAIVSARDGLLLKHGCLAAVRPSESRLLTRLIDQAARAAQGNALHPGGIMTISRPSQRRPLEVFVTPLRPGENGGLFPVDSKGSAIAVFISDPELQMEIPGDTLQRLYGLTPAEARLAAKLGSGISVQEAADQLGVTKETARGQLKQVYAKTDTHRQAELVRLILSGLSGLVRTD